MKQTTVHKAQPLRDENVPDLRIVAVKSQPIRRDSGANTESQLRDAEKIVAALTASLPGGTLDRVFGLLAMQRKQLAEKENQDGVCTT